jgi:hypothetical protein
MLLQIQISIIDFLHAFLVSNGNDTYHHEKNKNLVEHPTYAIEVFEKKIVTFITKNKGEP